MLVLLLTVEIEASCNSMVTDESSPCPKCGDTRKTIPVSAKNTVRLMQELGMQARDAKDRLRREYQSRTDLTKEGIIDRDLSGPEEVIHRSGTRSEPLVNFDEETKYVEIFVSALNMISGRSYEIEMKEKEDSGFPDRWLIDRTLPNESPERRVGVEVTHLDQRAIAGLKRDERFNLSGSMGAIVDSTVVAISKKHRIEPRAASQTYLLLTCPYPIPPNMQDDFRKNLLAKSPKRYFREVWVAPLKEPAFRIL
jgi:hypothetical protein